MMAGERSHEANLNSGRQDGLGELGDADAQEVAHFLSSWG